MATFALCWLQIWSRGTMGWIVLKYTTCLGAFSVFDPCNLFCWGTQPSGLQIHIHLSELCWERCQSNEVGQHLHSQYDPGNDCVSHLHCHSSKSLILRTNHSLTATVSSNLPSSASVFSCLDTSTDSGQFYVSTLEFLEDLEEKAEVDELLNWWNWYNHH